MKRLLLSLFLFASLSLWAQSPVAIGDILCTDGSTVKPNEFATSGKTALGIVFYVDSSHQHGWAVHPEYQGTTIWGDSHIDIPGLANFRKFCDAIQDTDGYTNTSIIRDCGDASTFPAAWAVDFENGWYLPAAGQFRQLYGYIPEINRSLNIVGGEPFLLSPDWLVWTSTECDGANAWDISYLGSEGHIKKGNHSFHVRAVRSF